MDTALRVALPAGPGMLAERKLLVVSLGRPLRNGSTLLTSGLDEIGAASSAGALTQSGTKCGLSFCRLPHWVQKLFPVSRTAPHASQASSSSTALAAATKPDSGGAFCGDPSPKLSGICCTGAGWASSCCGAKSAGCAKSAGASAGGADLNSVGSRACCGSGAMGVGVTTSFGADAGTSVASVCVDAAGSTTLGKGKQRPP